MLGRERWVLILLAAALPLASCGKPRAVYLAGPPSTLSGEPLVDDPEASCAQAVGAWFGRADTNKDGVLDLAEARADALRFFKAVDADGNAYLTPAELTDYRAKVYPAQYRGALSTPPPPSKPAPKTPGGSELPDPERRRFLMTPATADPVMAADQNLDFRVTEDEFVAKMAERGGRLDADHDGKVGRDEVLGSCQSR